jgi:hypothetical protein
VPSDFDDFIGQFVLGRSASAIPESWSRRTIGSWHMGYHAALPVYDILCSDSTVIGWLLGYPIDSTGSLVTEDVRFEILPEAAEAAEQFESLLYTYSGRFAAVWIGSETARFYVDPCGSLAVVYCREQQIVASTSGLIPVTEVSQDNEELIKAVMIPGTDNWFPFGLTGRYGVERVLPNHYLDLEHWEPVRHWPTEEIPATTDVGGAVGELASLVKTNISAIARDSACHMELTAGRDTRILLACAREHLNNISFFTFAVPTKQGRIDCQITRRMAKRFGLQHRCLGFEWASERELSDFACRTGRDVEGRAVHFLRLYNQFDPQRALIRGVGGEIGRGFHWRSGATETSAVTVAEIVDHTSRLSHPWDHPAIQDRAQRWLEGLSVKNSLTIWGLLYHEQYNGCWVGPKEYGYVNNHGYRIWAFCRRRIIELMLSLPTNYRRENLLPVDIMKQEWPELLDFSINWPVGFRRVLHAVKWRWGRLKHKLYFCSRSWDSK